MTEQLRAVGQAIGLEIYKDGFSGHTFEQAAAFTGTERHYLGDLIQHDMLAIVLLKIS